MFHLILLIMLIVAMFGIAFVGVIIFNLKYKDITKIEDDINIFGHESYYPDKNNNNEEYK